MKASEVLQTLNDAIARALANPDHLVSQNELVRYDPPAAFGRGVIVWLDPCLEFNGLKMGPAIILTPVDERRPNDRRGLPTFILYEGGNHKVKENLAAVAEQIADLVNSDESSVIQFSN